MNDVPQFQGGDLLPASKPVTLIVPQAPAGITQTEQAHVERQAGELAHMIGQSLENRDFMLRLDHLGAKEQEAAGTRIELIETRVNAVARVETKAGDIPATVTEMRSTIGRLDPKRKAGIVASILSALPGGDLALDWWMSSTLREIALKRETVREQIKQVRDGLISNKDRLAGDNQQLAGLYDHIRATSMAELQKTAYVCEILLGKLQEMMAAMAPEDPKRSRLQRAIEKIAVRIRHMRLTENALQQGLATIDITIDGNEKIGESLEETATLTMSYLTVAMALYQALAHQQDAIKALVAARKGTTDVMVKTSEMAKEGAESVSKVYFNPVEELQRVEEAQNNLMAALQILEDNSKNGLANAKTAIEKLRGMTAALREKQENLRASRGLSETPSN